MPSFLYLSVKRQITDSQDALLVRNISQLFFKLKVKCLCKNSIKRF